MIKNTFIGMVTIFLLTVMVMGSVVFAQTYTAPTPTTDMNTSISLTPTPTNMQTGVGGGPGIPSTGFGGMAHH